jgi:hypothetical protein
MFSLDIRVRFLEIKLPAELAWVKKERSRAFLGGVSIQRIFGWMDT